MADELKSTQEKLRQSETKCAELRNQTQTLKNELKLTQKVPVLSLIGWLQFNMKQCSFPMGTEFPYLLLIPVLTHENVYSVPHTY